VLDEKQNPFIKLNGDIINNPMASKRFSKTEIKQFKRLLFNTIPSKGIPEGRTIK